MSETETTNGETSNVRLSPITEAMLAVDNITEADLDKEIEFIERRLKRLRVMKAFFKTQDASPRTTKAKKAPVVKTSAKKGGEES